MVTQKNHGHHRKNPFSRCGAVLRLPQLIYRTIGPIAFVLVGGLLLAAAACDGGDGNKCVVNNNPSGVDGGLQCGLPFELNETDNNGNVIGPGAFGVKVVEYVHVNAAGIVETDTISVLLFLAYIDYHPETPDAELGVQLCQIQIPQVDIPGQPEPTIFRTLPEMMPNIPIAWVHADLSGTTTCESFTSDKAITIIGACLEDELEDDLPAVDAVCPGTLDPNEKDTYCQTQPNCNYDVDMDGYVAATLEAENLPGLDVDLVFANMRSWVAMDGFVATDDMILGNATFDLRVHPLGCRLTPLGGGDQRDCNSEELKIVTRINPDITQTPGQDSTFIAVRIDSDLTCEELIERELEIFGR